MTCKDSCKDCRFFTTKHSDRVTLEEGVGYCQRNAPRGPVAVAWIEAGKTDRRGVVLPFPVVADDCWCGEFQKVD